MAITQNHVINIQPGVSAPLVIHCSQGDTGTQINLTVVNGDEEFDCSSYACSVHGVRSDGGNWGPITCTVSGSTVCFSLTSAMTAVAGACLAEVSIGTVGTANFALLVENATFESGVTYSNDVSVYQNILTAVQTGISNETAERVAAVETEKNERVAADNSLSSRIFQNDARINNLIVSSGSDSSAEVIDARTGYDNTVYDTLGNAIRDQIGTLTDSLGVNHKTLSFTDDTYIRADGMKISGSSSHHVLSEVVRLKKGNMIKVTCKGKKDVTSIISSVLGGVYKPLIICDSNDNKTYRYTAYEDIDVVISAGNEWNKNVLIGYYDIINTIFDLSNVADINHKTLSFTDDTYIRADGMKISGSSSHHVLSEVVRLKKGNMIKVTCKGEKDVTSIISSVLGGVYKPLIICDSNDNKTYRYTAYEDIDVVISAGNEWNKNVLIGYYDIINTIFDLSNVADINHKTLSFTDDTYIRADGMKISGSSSHHVLSEVVRLKKGNMIKVTCKGEKDVTSIISSVLGGVYKPLIICDSNDNKTYRYTAYEDIDVVISAGNEWNKNVLIVTFDFLTNIPIYKLYVDFSLFRNFGVVGDSYASGEMYFNDSYVDNYTISWGQILARKCGNTCVNYSKGGLTTRSWLTDVNYGLKKLLEIDANDLYILALGINDYYHLGETYLGTISDIKDDYSQNSDTFYGNYGKIIAQIMNHAPHAKIIIADIVNTQSKTIVDNFNKAIYKIADRFNIACIKQSKYWFFNSSFYIDNMVQGHPIAKVYSGMALSFKELIEQSIKENPSYFNDLFMF